MQYAYLVAAVCFIFALRGLSSPETARQGNLIGMAGMALAVGASLILLPSSSYLGIFITILAGGSIGALIARKIPMTALPQLVACFHSLVGLAAVLVAFSSLLAPQSYGIGNPGEIPISARIEMSLGGAIGAITFTASLVAFGKLQGIFSALIFRGRHLVNIALGVGTLFALLLFTASESVELFLLLVILAGLLGILLIMPIGGADMPVIVSMLNSYSGWAACGIGFTLSNIALIITGALVGASGAILSYIMCRGMNRSILNVLVGGFGTSAESQPEKSRPERPVRAGSPEDAAFLMKQASSIIIVPGYGMAAAQAQHALREIADALKANEATVRYAIHPVAGRMPGHMNVLLAEANVPYEDVFELEHINRDFAQTDIVFVIGANDITNPAAKNDPTSPIYGMPILEVSKAGTVLFVKRSLASGYAGIDNELFYMERTMMLFGDAKQVCEKIIGAL